jgi:hypothetical protein
MNSRISIRQGKHALLGTFTPVQAHAEHEQGLCGQAGPRFPCFGFPEPVSRGGVLSPRLGRDKVRAVVSTLSIQVLTLLEGELHISNP